MPEITPVAAAAPAAPAAVAGVAPANATPNDATASAFVGQLTAALKSLASVVGGKPATPSQATADGTSLPGTADDGAEPVQSSDTDAPSDDVAELLASLGLVMAPVPQLTQQPVASDTPQPSVGNGVTAPVQTDASDLMQTVAPQAGEPAKPDAAPMLDAQKLAAPAEPQKGAAPEAQATATEAQATGTEAQGAPRQADAVTQPHEPTTLVAPPIQPQMQNGASGGSFQSSDDEHSRHDAHSKAESVGEVTTAVPTVPPEHVVAAAATVVNAPAAPPPSPPATATNVAQQIAQQVDLYRLPGNKGVRIQLHPDDLGGVEVTLKYAAGGSLELHISVEHAATGSLVQEGLAQLRDALATQGFQADRLVMSVSAPAGAGQTQMDFNANSGNGGYRSDAGLTGFSQDGQSGQQRDGGSGADDWRGGRGWNAMGDPISSSDDVTRAASVYAAASRIDYRV